MQQDAEGKLISIAPVSADAPQYFADVSEVGKFVEALVKAPSAGKHMLGYNGRKSFAEIASIVAGITGVPGTVIPMSVDEMAASIPGVGKVFGTVGRFILMSIRLEYSGELSNVDFQEHFGWILARRLGANCSLHKRYEVNDMLLSSSKALTHLIG